MWHCIADVFNQTSDLRVNSQYAQNVNRTTLNLEEKQQINKIFQLQGIFKAIRKTYPDCVRWVREEIDEYRDGIRFTEQHFVVRVSSQN